MSKTLQRKKAPAIVDAVNFDLHLKPYTKFILRNGVEVYTVNAGAEEVMSLEFVFSAGNSFEEKNLVAATANYLLKNGTGSRTAFEINEQVDYYGAYLNRACYNETATVTLHTLSKHIGKLLPVVRDIITDSRLPEEEIDIYRQSMKQRLLMSLRKSEFIAGRLIDAYLYGEDHPYGKYSKEEDFDALQRAELLEFYQQYYRDGKLVIFAAGRLPSNLEALLNEYFGDLSNNDRTAPDRAIVAASEKKVRLINDENGVQGSIRIARPFPNRHHPDFQKTLVLNTVFGGFFGSRLMENIREDKGYTYGIHSYLQNHINHSAWMIGTEAGREVSEATIEEVYREMADLRDEIIDEEELLLVRNYMIGGILGELDGPFQIIARWKNIVLNGMDESYFYNSINTIKSVTAEELQVLAKKYLNPEDFYELVVV